MGASILLGHYDGAARGNHVKRKVADAESQIAFGVVFSRPTDGTWIAAWASKLHRIKFTSPAGREHTLSVTTGNNRAEMIGCTDLYQAAWHLKRLGAKFKTFISVGDSEFTMLQFADYRTSGLSELRE